MKSQTAEHEATIHTAGGLWKSNEQKFSDLCVMCIVLCSSLSVICYQFHLWTVNLCIFSVLFIFSDSTLCCCLLIFCVCAFLCLCVYCCAEQICMLDVLYYYKCGNAKTKIKPKNKQKNNSTTATISQSIIPRLLKSYHTQHSGPHNTRW